MGPRTWESIQGPLVRHQTQLLISIGGLGLLFRWRFMTRSQAP
jgi:hypothetical protein